MILKLLFALLLALPARAVEVRADPQAVVQGIALHLDNLKALTELPQAPLKDELKTAPDHALTTLPASYIQQAYLREATVMPQAGDAAGGLIVEAVARHPALVGKISEKLQAALPDDPRAVEAAEKLWRFAGEQRDARKEDDPGAAQRAWQRLEKIFDGRVSVPGLKFDLDAPAANDDGFTRRKGDLLAAPGTLKPKRAQVDAWMNDGGRDAVELAFGRMDPVLASELLSLLGAPLEYHAAAAAWLRTGNADARLALAQRPDLLQAFYLIRRRHEGVLRERHHSLPEIVNAYKGQGNHALKAVLDHTVEQDGDYLTEQNPRTWSLLSEAQKEQAVEHMGPENFFTRHTAKLYLELRPDTDLAELSERYALGRNPRVLERYLSLRRGGGRGKTVQVPLENVLPSWIRKAFERFEECTGANCVNAALGVHENKRHRHRYVTGEEMLQTLGSAFEKVRPGSELEVGDLLVYTNMNKQFLHMAAYVGEDYVFNKAGASRYNPYVFQHRAIVETSYFEPGGLRLLVFRRKKT